MRLNLRTSNNKCLIFDLLTKYLIPYISQFSCMVLKFGAFMIKMIITRARKILLKKTCIFFVYKF